MLSDEVVDKVVERLIDRIEQGNTFVLNEIARSIKKIGQVNPTKAYQLLQTLEYGGDFNKIIKRLEKITELNTKEIYQIFDEIAKKDYNFAKKYYDYRNIPFIPYEENLALKLQVEALATITAQEYINLTNTTSIGFGFPNRDGSITFKGLKESYYDILDEAVLSVSQGKEAFDSAMYRQLENVAESGLKVVYPTTYIDKKGIERHYVRRIDSAMRMNMDGAIANLHNKLQETLGKQFDSDGVEISVHPFPAIDHQLAQGKQFSNEEFTKLQEDGIARTYDEKQVNLYTGKRFRPISEWNCKHYTFAIVLGVDNPQYSNEQLENIIKENKKGFEFGGKHYTMYDGTQLQRQIETEIRRQKEKQKLGETSGVSALTEKSTRNIKRLKRKYNELVKTSGLMPRVDRMRVF